MRESVCSRSASVLRRVISFVSCFASRTDNQRDEFKTSRGSGSARDSTTEFRGPVEEDDDEGGQEPGSGDEDVLTSLGASYRAWRVYYREKRAHDYTKSRLVATFQREARLLKLIAHMGGSVESVELTLMTLEDLKATVVRLEEKAHSSMSGLVMYEDLALELEASKAQCQAYKERLQEANAVLLNRRSHNHDGQLDLKSNKLETRLRTGELRWVKKASVLAMSRQFVQLDAQNDANGSKKRSISSIEIV